MPSSNPANPGCIFSRLLNGRYISHVKKKNAGKLLLLAINALLNSLAALAATFSAVAFIVTFYNDAKPPPKWIWCITNPSPALKRLRGKIWLRLRRLPGLADRATSFSASPHLSCKRDQIKMREYVDWRVTPPKPGTSLTWGAPQPHADKKVDLFVTQIVIQISNTYLLEFLIASQLTLYKCVVNVCIQR